MLPDPSPSSLTTGCHILGADFEEAKILFAARAALFMSHWNLFHPRSFKISQNFDSYDVPLPPFIPTPALDPNYLKIQDMHLLIKYAVGFATSIATASCSWLFLRQVIAYRGLSIPPYFPHPWLHEPLYQISYVNGLPVGIQMQEGTPVYSYLNNGMAYIDIRGAIAMVSAHGPPKWANRYLQTCTPKEEEDFRNYRAQLSSCDPREKTCYPETPYKGVCVNLPDILEFKTERAHRDILNSWEDISIPEEHWGPSFQRYLTDNPEEEEEDMELSLTPDYEEDIADKMARDMGRMELTDPLIINTGMGEWKTGGNMVTWGDAPYPFISKA